ncbi:MAG: hypothetical protein GX446_18580 [Chthonomonadales bacterium]|nr:hypothetical protein [Chthonomonadales bacterium]
MVTRHLVVCVTVLSVLAGLPAVADDGASEASLRAALRRLTAHVQQQITLTPDRINGETRVIAENVRLIGNSRGTLRDAFALVSAYEDRVGPLFLTDATRSGLPRKPQAGRELDYALIAVQQGLIDHAYTPSNLSRFADLLDGAFFKTSAYFPGAVASRADPRVVHRVRINASQPRPWGSPVMYDEDPARRPTGCYLAPGDIATVTVPPAMVSRGFSVRVGAHSWDLAEKPRMLRLDRVSLVYPIEAADTLVANPLGGGIYIEVPPNADLGLVTVTIRRAVRSPFFSATRFHKTTLREWREVERKHPGPWADFETDKFMMQVPTDWIYAFDDPAKLMRDWDRALDCVSDLFGRPRVRPKSVLYLQVDVVIRGSAYFPGYPQSNFSYSPHKKEGGHSSHWLLKGPRSGAATIFHELGHAQLFTKFSGEVEAVVNLPYVAVLNKGFGVDLDTAFGMSFDNENISLDQAAIMWMVTENFRQGKPMDISDSERNEVRYQHRGYAKYVEIAKLFGWKALERFWRSVQLDYLKGIDPPRNDDPTDNRILRMSRAAGADLTPLIHFWGVQPDDPAALRQAISAAGLKPSRLIYDRLVHYKTLIPMSNAEFAKHARTIYPRGLREGQSPLYGEGWYQVWLQKYDASHGEAAAAALQNIITRYFPTGRP